MPCALSGLHPSCIQDVYKTADQIKAAGGQITREPGPVPGIGTKIVKTAFPKVAIGLGYKRPSARWADCWACWSLPARISHTLGLIASQTKVRLGYIAVSAERGQLS